MKAIILAGLATLAVVGSAKPAGIPVEVTTASHLFHTNTHTASQASSTKEPKISLHYPQLPYPTSSQISTSTINTVQKEVDSGFHHSHKPHSTTFKTVPHPVSSSVVEKRSIRNFQLQCASGKDATQLYVGKDESGKAYYTTCAACSSKCVCTYNGLMMCGSTSTKPSPFAIAETCAKGAGCTCKDQNAQKQSVETTSEAASSLIERSNGLSCKKSKTNKSGLAGKCNNGKSLMWTSEDCLANCRCNGKGLYCPPPKGCSLTGDLSSPTRFCAGNADFSCSCTASEAEADVLMNTEVARQVDTPPNSIYQAKPACSLPRTDEPGLVGICHNLSRLMWRASDCIQYCKCKGDSLICHDPSGCRMYSGPYHATEFCKNNDDFHCGCLSGQENEIKGNQATPKIEAPADKRTEVTEVKPEAASLEIRDANCRGPNTLSTLWIGHKCDDRSYAIYLNGEYCRTHCECAGSGIVCRSNGQPDGINVCGGDEAVTRFCTTVRPQFTCSC